MDECEWLGLYFIVLRGGFCRLCAWWRHQMETFSTLLAICAGNSPVPGEFPVQTPVTQTFDVFFDLRLNKRLSKQWWGCWFETLSLPLWRHSNGITCGAASSDTSWHCYYSRFLPLVTCPNVLLLKNVEKHFLNTSIHLNAFNHLKCTQNVLKFVHFDVTF